MPISESQIRARWNEFRKLESKVDAADRAIANQKALLRKMRRELDEAISARDALFKQAAMARFQAQDLEMRRQFEQGEHR